MRAVLHLNQIGCSKASWILKNAVVRILKRKYNSTRTHNKKKREINKTLTLKSPSAAINSLCSKKGPEAKLEYLL